MIFCTLALYNLYHAYFANRKWTIVKFLDVYGYKINIFHKLSIHNSQLFSIRDMNSDFLQELMPDIG